MASSSSTRPGASEIVGRSGRARSTHRAGRSRGSRASAIAGWAAILVVAVVVAAPVLFGAVARGASPSPSAAASGSQQSGANVAAGAALFQQSCATCHGVQGEGAYNADGTIRGPDIRNVGAAAADFVLRTGRMPLSDPGQPMQRGPVKFTAQQIADLTAYVASFGNGPGIPQVDTTGADISRGRALFNANCAACHAPTGAGNAVGGGFNAPGLGEADPLTVAEAMRVGPIPMPVFGPGAFSQQDLNDIAAYVQYLRNSESPGGLGIGEIGPVPEGFIAFVFGLTVVLLITRFVARRGRTGQQTTLHPGADRHEDGVTAAEGDRVR